MITTAPTPADRATFNDALSTLHAEHATMRRLATCAMQQPSLCTDVTLSLVDAMAAHESTEARLFELPFLTRTPEAVSMSAVRARRRCLDYTSGDFDCMDADTASAFLVEALLIHLAAEEDWLAEEKAQKNERLWTSI